MAQDLPAGQKVAQAHDEAIREARSGQLPQAIALLDRLAAEVPTDLGIRVGPSCGFNLGQSRRRGDTSL